MPGSNLMARLVGSSIGSTDRARGAQQPGGPHALSNEETLNQQTVRFRSGHPACGDE